MGGLASLVAGLASGETAAALRRAKLAAIYYGLAALLALCGAGFLLGAACIALARQFGPIHATLGFGIGFLVLAGLIVLVFKLTADARQRRRARERKADLTALGITAGLAALPMLMRARVTPKDAAQALVWPVIAGIAYEIYKENSRPAPKDPDL